MPENINPRATVLFENPKIKITEGLTENEVMMVIRANFNQIRHCYEQLLQRSPSASGKIAVNFTVGLSGSVSSVSVAEATLNDSVMRGCVTGHIQRWDFPKPRGGQPVTVNYPFVFNPL
jgi:TonB family protein